MRQKAIITPKLLRWARETSKMSINDIALKMKMKNEKIESWENGDDFPTINQLEKIAKYYRRPISIFYLPEPPDDFQTLRDFRKSNGFDDYSTALSFIIRDIQSKQIWLSEFVKDEGEKSLDFIGKYSLESNIDTIARDIKSFLNIGDFKHEKNVLNYWVDKIEQKRIFVSLTSNIHSHLKIDIDEVKGFAISDKYAPFIFVNSGDGKNSQLFTLIHELVHLWVNVSGVSSFNVVDFRDTNEQNKYEPVEIFCNRVTAEILMPRKEIVNIAKSISLAKADNIEKIAKEMKVSSFALLVRLLNLKIVSKREFNNIKKVFREQYEAFKESEAKKPKTKGGPNYYILKIRKNSKAFTSYIFSNYKSGKISGSEANKLLDIKVSNFNKLENFLYA